MKALTSAETLRITTLYVECNVCACTLADSRKGNAIAENLTGGYRTLRV